jgi:hypothetical protein
VNGIAKWDGASWSALGSGMTGPVKALEVYDDGSGPALYAGGNFPIAGGVLVHACAKWDGANWSDVGGGVDRRIDCLTVFDDGTGPVLVAGGTFQHAGGVAVEHVARWDGTQWRPCGTGLGGFVSALAVFDDGSGPALYAAGYDVGVARWNGPSWSAVGGGANAPSKVDALAVYDDSSGPALYAGGTFTQAGSGSASHIAKWDGTTWSPVGDAGSDGLDGSVYALRVLQSGRRPVLHVGGDFSLAGGVAARNVATWNGHRWAPLGTGFDNAVLAFGTFDDGSQELPLVVAGGAFRASDAGDSFLAAWRNCLAPRTR